MSIGEGELSLLRITGKGSQSDAVLAKVLDNTANTKPEFLPINSRFNARSGKLVHSRAENLIESDNLEAAQRQLLRRMPVDKYSPSSMMKTVHFSNIVSLGPFSRHNVISKMHLRFWARHSSKSKPRMSWQVDGGQHFLPMLEISIPELDDLRMPKPYSYPSWEGMRVATSYTTSSSRRLQSVLAESYIRDGSCQHASKILANLRRAVANKKEKGIITSRIFFFRTWTMLARIAEVQQQ